MKRADIYLCKFRRLAELLTKTRQKLANKLGRRNPKKQLLQVHLPWLSLCSVTSHVRAVRQSYCHRHCIVVLQCQSLQGPLPASYHISLLLQLMACIHSFQDAVWLPDAVPKQKAPQPKFTAAPAAQNAAEVQRFQFDTPSPDDAVLAAQKQATGSARNAKAPQSNQAQPAASSQTSQPQQATDAQAITEGKPATVQP